MKEPELEIMSPRPMFCSLEEMRSGHFYSQTYFYLSYLRDTEG